MKFKIGDILYLKNENGIFEVETGIEIVGEYKAAIETKLLEEALYEHLWKGGEWDC